jgi:hypothetical protein
MYRYNLAPCMEDCPKGWQNFIGSLGEKFNGDPHYPIICKELQSYGVIEYNSYTEEPYVLFNEEGDATAFLLTWG